MVSKELIALVKCLKELDVKTFEELEHRISFQKKIYLLQVCGVNLGYMFGWDKYGPYSRELSRNAGIYAEDPEIVDSVMDRFHFTQPILQGIEKTKKLISIPSDLGDIREIEFLEFLSSLHFLATDGGRLKDLPTDTEKIKQINEAVIGTKPHLKKYERYLGKIWEHLYMSFPPAKPH